MLLSADAPSIFNMETACWRKQSSHVNNCSNPQWCLQNHRPPIIHRCPPHSVWVKQCPPWCLITRPCYFCSCTFKIQLFSFCSFFFFFSRALFFRALLMHNSFPLFFGSPLDPGRLQNPRLGSRPAWLEHCQTVTSMMPEAPPTPAQPALLRSLFLCVCVCVCPL